MLRGIEGKLALVTAASQGIGYACAHALAENGARLCIASSSRENIDKAASALERDFKGLSVRGYVCDMRDANDIDQLCARINAEAGVPEILVNNTGGPKPGGFFELSLDEWQEGYQLLMASTVALYKRLIPAMQERHWGRVVNVTSTTSYQPIKNLTLSNSFRPGILGLAKTVADEVGKDGVLINTVMPGITMTARMKQLSRGGKGDTIVDRLRKETALQRAADPAELGRAVAFLCSNEASFITGSAIAVDGGSIRSI